MKIKLQLSFLFALCGMLFTFAQTAVSGSVVGSDGQPIPGATVLVQGTSNGTTSDFDGNFTISVEENQVVEISYVGYATQAIAYTGQDTLAVTLEQDLNELEEIADLVAYLASDEASFINGNNIDINGGLAFS